MAENTPQSPPAPWHFWVIAILAVLWNAMGAMDFTMTELRSTAYLKDYTPEQRGFFASFPFWAVGFWALGTWGGFLGSLFMLIRRRLAVPLFAVSIIGVIVTNVYCYLLSDWPKVMKVTAGSIAFALVIFVIAVLLWRYASEMRRRGFLR